MEPGVFTPGSLLLPVPVDVFQLQVLHIADAAAGNPATRSAVSRR
jgi:hypothetical protein